jgi:hypothetical protein
MEENRFGRKGRRHPHFYLILKAEFFVFILEVYSKLYSIYLLFVILCGA